MNTPRWFHQSWEHTHINKSQLHLGSDGYFYKRIFTPVLGNNLFFPKEPALVT
jgi:hypothetical protein